MLLKIDFKPEDVVYQANGRIVLKVHHYGPFAHGCHMLTTTGETMADFDSATFAHIDRTAKHKIKRSKTVLVGVSGGISLD